MLMQVGGEGTRPTFFEMAAAQHLPSSLRAALLYSLGVMAQRRPILHRVLDYSDEAFAALMLLLEVHSLRISDASFAEALYGLRRMSGLLTAESGPSSINPIDQRPSRLGSITRRQRSLSVLFLVGLPYLKSKMELVYNAQRGGALQAAFWSTGDTEMVEMSSTSDDSGGSTGDERSETGSLMGCMISRLRRLCFQFYPWLHSTNEGLSFAYQLLYLLDATQYYSPALHILGIQVCRASGQELVGGTISRCPPVQKIASKELYDVVREGSKAMFILGSTADMISWFLMMDASKHIAERRNREFERLRGSPLIQSVQRGLLRTAYGVLDYAQSGLIAAVFIFKMVEWWYQSAEPRVSAPSVYPPPPPPPAPKVAKDGIPLQKDRTTCPLCLQTRTNPAMAAVSGYVFCYPCIFNYVTQYKRCPVTLMPATQDQIRRLYYDS